MSHTISNSTDSDGSDADTRRPESARRRSQQVRNARRLGVQPSLQLRSHFLALARRIRNWENHRSDLVGITPVTIGITSLQERAGRSTVALNLADALAGMNGEPCLLVETEAARHSIVQRVAPRKPGLVQWLDDRAEVSACITQLPMDNIRVMGVGISDSCRLEELPFEGLSARIQEQLDEYSHVIWDLPVADELTACFSIAAELDGVILVVPCSAVVPQTIQKFRQRLAECETDLIGIVLNEV